LLSASALGSAYAIYNDRYREMTDEQMHEILKDKIKYPPPRIIERKPVQRIEENDNKKDQEPNENDSKGKGGNRHNNDYNPDDDIEVK
jgi:hypothetical protein